MTCFYFRSTIRDKIIPHAVSWFTGDALAGEDFEDDDDEGDEDDEEDEDEDEDEEDEDDEDDEDDEEEEVHSCSILLQSWFFSIYYIYGLVLTLSLCVCVLADKG